MTQNLQNQLPTARDTAVNIKKSSFSQEDADHPPDSYSIPKRAELDWFVRNAFFQRKYSTRANSSSVSASNSLLLPKQLRKSDSSIIWIPKTQRRSSLPETKFRRATPPIRLVPRRTDVVVVVAGNKTEPSSPKVSCTGRVSQKKNKPAKKSKKKIDTPSDHRRKSSATLWTRLREIFRSGKLTPATNDAEATATRRSKSSRVQQSSLGEPVPGSLTRFSSGRKSDSWIMQMKTAIEKEVDTLHFDQKGIGLWSRRNLEAPKPLHCVRNWLDSGPASV